jgi:hypothetical protein
MFTRLSLTFLLVAWPPLTGVKGQTAAAAGPSADHLSGSTVAPVTASRLAADYLRIQFSSPISPAVLRAVRQAGADVLDVLSPDVLLVRAPDGMNPVAAMPDVVSARMWDSGDKPASPGLVSGTVEGGGEA